MATKGQPRIRMPKGNDLYQMGLSKGYDKGAELERERVLKILRRRVELYDEEVEAPIIRAMNWAIEEIQG